MLTLEQIAKLNSDSINISVNTDHTKSVLKELWKNSSNHQKLSAVALGSYEGVNVFNPVLDTGKISLQMAIVLAQTFEISPFYITGEQTNDTYFDDAVLNDFLNSYNDFLAITETLSTTTLEINPATKAMLQDMYTNIIDNIEISEELLVHETIQIINELNNQARIQNLTAVIKLSLIKRILEY